MTENTETYNEEQVALAKYLEIEPDDLREGLHDHYGLPVYRYGSKEYAIGFDAECDVAVKNAIKDSLWAFTSDFIANVCGLPEFQEGLKPMQEKLCEGANDSILALIRKTCGLQEFVDEAVSADGRGHFLSPYDGNENDSNRGKFFIYRVN